jgi:hypothetical protein
MSYDPPTLSSTVTLNTATYNSLNCSGNITDDGNRNITLRGFVALEDATTGDPTASTYDEEVSQTGSDLGTGSFSNTLASLLPDTPYRVRAYAENQEGYGYSNTYTFYTAQILDPTTWSNRTDEGADFASSAESGITITKRGFVWLKASSGDPTYASNDGYVEDTGTLSTGAFSKTVTGLDANSAYRVRAFSYSATYGYQYSDTIDFTTLPAGYIEVVQSFDQITSIGTGTDWVNPSNAETDDTSYASIGITAANDCDTLWCTYAGFSIPTGAQIQGVLVSVRFSCGSNCEISYPDIARLIVGGSLSGNDQETTHDTIPASTLITNEYGGFTNTWGVSGGLSVTDVNATNFGFGFKVNRIGSGTSSVTRVEYVEISVYYTLPAQVLEGVASLSDTTSQSGTLTATKAVLASGVASLSDSPSTVGTLVTNKDRQFTGVASLSTVLGSHLSYEQSVSSIDVKISTKDGEAMFFHDSIDFSGYAGTDTGNAPRKIIFTDSAGKKATAWCGAVGGGVGFGSNLVSNSTFESGVSGWNDGYYYHLFDLEWDETNQRLAFSSLIYGSVHPDLINGTLGKLLFINADTDCNVGIGENYNSYQPTHSLTPPLSCTNNISDSSLYVNFQNRIGDYVTTYIDNVEVKAYTDVPSTGLHLVSGANSTTRNFASIDAGFDANDVVTIQITESGVLGKGLAFTAVASISEVPVVAGTTIRGYALTGVVSLSEAPSQSGDLSTGYILSGVASLSATPSLAGDLAAYTGQLFDGVASLSQVSSESGTLVADSDQILTGVASLSSTPAVAGTALIAQLFAVTGVASISEVPVVAGTTIIKQAVVAQGVASLSTSPAETGSTIIGILAAGVASLSDSPSLVGTHIAGQIYTGVASLSDVPSVAGTLTALQTILSQYGFRFRNDDGTDVTATWRASQNANIALSGEDSFRIRFGINGNDDPSITPQLEYRLKKSGGSFGAWKKVTNGN